MYGCVLSVADVLFAYLVFFTHSFALAAWHSFLYIYSAASNWLSFAMRVDAASYK